MAERKFFIVVVCFLFFNIASYAQHKSVEFFPDFISKPLSNQYNTRIKFVQQQGLNINAKTSFRMILSTTSKKENFFSLAPDFYNNHIGFFCQQELKFEKATAIPLRFRLGSVAYTDYLEQKPNALRQ